jgi:hypothetical protein
MIQRLLDIVAGIATAALVASETPFSTHRVSRGFAMKTLPRLNVVRRRGFLIYGTVTHRAFCGAVPLFVAIQTYAFGRHISKSDFSAVGYIVVAIFALNSGILMGLM